VLCGALPFPGKSYGELVVQIATATPVPVLEQVPGLAPEVAACIARAMARRPAERFQRLDEMIAMFERFAASEFATSSGRPTAPMHPDRATDDAPLPLAEAGALDASAWRERTPIARLSGRRYVRGAGYVAACVLLAGLALLWLRSRNEVAQPSGVASPASRTTAPEAILAQPVETKPPMKAAAPATPIPAQSPAPPSSNWKPAHHHRDATKPLRKAPALPEAESADHNPLQMNIQ
jgi:hypothetical protein